MPKNRRLLSTRAAALSARSLADPPERSIGIIPWREDELRPPVVHVLALPTRGDPPGQHEGRKNESSTDVVRAEDGGRPRDVLEATHVDAPVEAEHGRHPPGHGYSRPACAPRPSAGRDRVRSRYPRAVRPGEQHGGRQGGTSGRSPPGTGGWRARSPAGCERRRPWCRWRTLLTRPTGVGPAQASWQDGGHVGGAKGPTAALPRVTVRNAMSPAAHGRRRFGGLEPVGPAGHHALAHRPVHGVAVRRRRRPRR